jgi:hypothetical protein
VFNALALLQVLVLLDGGFRWNLNAWTLNLLFTMLPDYEHFKSKHPCCSNGEAAL